MSQNPAVSISMPATLAVCLSICDSVLEIALSLCRFSRDGEQWRLGEGDCDSCRRSSMVSRGDNSDGCCSIGIFDL